MQPQPTAREKWVMELRGACYKKECKGVSDAGKGVMVITIRLFSPSDNYYRQSQLTSAQFLKYLRSLQKSHQRNVRRKPIQGNTEDGAL